MRLISAEDVIRWADAMIIATEQPKPWLIDLAISRPDAHDVISMLRHHDATTEVDDDTFLALVAYGYFQSRLTLEQVRSNLYARFCLIDWKVMTPLRQLIYVFDDEMGWDVGKARWTCETILQPFREAGAKLVVDFNRAV